MNPAAALQATTAVVNVRPQGMTPTAYIMLVLVLTAVPLLAGILIALIKRGPVMKKLDYAKDDTLLTHALERIDSLEKAQVEERRACEDKLRAMQAQIDGLIRQIVAQQVASGRAMGFTPEATASAERVLAHIERRENEA